ncbi:MAG: DUF115 domain-containing protein [Chlamydiia bacterium]|nr:DUF115 domain-containing protein [Chlamydiia bacterium]
MSSLVRVELGAERVQFASLQSWVEEDLQRRLVFVDADEEGLECLKEEALGHLQIQFFHLSTPVYIEALAKTIAWRAVLAQLHIVNHQPENSLYSFLHKKLEEMHLAAGLILSDAADWGCPLVHRLGLQRKRLVRDGYGLAGVFAEIPAIIVGAGPSLEKGQSVLRDLQKKALIFAGGSALNMLEIEPHFAGSIDKEAPYAQFKKRSFWETPFLFQSRMNGENFASLHGEMVRFPESHHAFINWLQGEERTFAAGWVVGNFLASVAALMGCNPIIFVGMDLCYAERTTSTHCVETVNGRGARVSTQRDWLMARDWMGELARAYSGQTFLNVEAGGLAMPEPIRVVGLENLGLPELGGLRKRVHQAVQGLPVLVFQEERGRLWEESLLRCKGNIEQCLMGKGIECEGESAYEELLRPLWHVWRPIFERELDLDPYKLEKADKLELHRRLFMQQVIEAHLSCMRQGYSTQAALCTQN